MTAKKERTILKYTKREFEKLLKDKLMSECNVTLDMASADQIYRCLAMITRQIMSDRQKQFQSKVLGEGKKQVYYLCMEFLMGRSLMKNAFNLELLDDLTAEEIACAETATAGAESIQRESGEEGFTLENVLCTSGIEDGILERVALRDAIARLQSREQTVIVLRYFHALTQEKVAQIVGVSQVQVSRIEKKALERLRTFF